MNRIKPCVVPDVWFSLRTVMCCMCYVNYRKWNKYPDKPAAKYAECHSNRRIESSPDSKYNLVDLWKPRVTLKVNLMLGTQMPRMVYQCPLRHCREGSCWVQGILARKTGQWVLWEGRDMTLYGCVHRGCRGSPHLMVGLRVLRNMVWMSWQRSVE